MMKPILVKWHRHNIFKRVKQLDTYLFLSNPFRRIQII